MNKEALQDWLNGGAKNYLTKLTRMIWDLKIEDELEIDQV